MEEKTYPLNLQNTSYQLSKSLLQLTKAYEETKKEKYANANQWLQRAVNNITQTEQQLDPRHVGMMHQLKIIYSYLLSIGSINASTKEDALWKMNKSAEYLGCMFLYIYNPSVKVKPLKEKIEIVRNYLCSQKDASLGGIISDLNKTIDILVLCSDKENKNVIIKPVFILYWLEMVKRDLDSLIEEEEKYNLKPASYLLGLIIAELKAIVEAPTSEEVLSAIIQLLRKIGQEDLGKELNGIVNRIENVLEHLDDGAIVKKLEKIEEKLEELEEEHEEQAEDSTLKQEINKTIAKLEDILTTINGIPIKFDSLENYQLEDNDNDTVPRVIAQVEDIWLKFKPYPIFITVDLLRNISFSDAWVINYTSTNKRVVGDPDDYDPAVPSKQPKEIVIGTEVRTKNLENLLTGFPVVILRVKEIKLYQTASYTLGTTRSSETRGISSPFSSPVTDLDQDGISNNVEYEVGSSPTDAKIGRQIIKRYNYTNRRAKDYVDTINITRYIREPIVIKEIIENSTIFLTTHDLELTFSVNLVPGTYEISSVEVNGVSAQTFDPKDHDYNQTKGNYTFSLLSYAVVKTTNDTVARSVLNSTPRIEFYNETKIFPVNNTSYTVNITLVENTTHTTAYKCNHTFNYTFEKDLPDTYNLTLSLAPQATKNISVIYIPTQIEIRKLSAKITKDEDSDNLTLEEEERYHTSPCNRDTDNDYFWDGAEVEFWHIMYNLTRNVMAPNYENDTKKISENVTRKDYDDNMPDGYEVIYYTNITDPDSDDDRLTDFDEVFQYFKVGSEEAENAYASGNATVTNEAVTLTDTYKNAGLKVKIPKDGIYRIKLVGESDVSASKNQTEVNETIYKLTEKRKHFNLTSYWYNTSYKAIPDERLNRATDKFFHKNVNVRVNQGGLKTTGNIVLDMKRPATVGLFKYLNTTQGRFLSVYKELSSGKHVFQYTFEPIQNADATWEIDYIVIERQGLDPWDPDTDDDGVMDGDEVIKYGTSPWENDTDKDGIWDAEEICYFDMNGLFPKKKNINLSHTENLSIPLLGNGTPARINLAELVLESTGKRLISATGRNVITVDIDYVEINDVIHLVWANGSGNTYQIYYSNSTDGGKNWSPPLQLSHTKYDSVEPSIAVDGNNNVHVVWKEVKPGRWGVTPGDRRWVQWWLYLYKDEVYVLRSDGRTLDESSGYRARKNGTCYEFAVVTNTALISDIIKNGLWFRWYWVPGDTWVHYKNLSSESTRVLDKHKNLAVAEPKIIATPNDGLHVIFSEGYVLEGPGPYPLILPAGWIKYTRSNDGGSSWSDLKTIGTARSGANPNAIADANGYIYAAWENSSYENSRCIKFTRSLDEGINWAEEQIVVESSASPIGPTLAAGNGYVFLAYARDYGGDYEIAYIKSTDHGSEWGAEIRATTASGVSVCPKIDLDDNFNLHIVWQDNRTNGIWRVYYQERRANDDQLLLGDLQISGNHSVLPAIVANTKPHIVWISVVDDVTKVCYLRYDPETAPKDIKVTVNSELVFNQTGIFAGVVALNITENVSKALETVVIANNTTLLRNLAASNYTALYLANVPITISGSGNLTISIKINLGGVMFRMGATGNDEDTDGLLDVVELGYSDDNPSTFTNPTSKDSDNDGLLDGEEDSNKNGRVEIGVETDPNHRDTDHDSLPDKWELDHGSNAIFYDNYYDYDFDSLTNLQEYNLDTMANQSDTDDDRLSDRVELVDILFRTNIEKGAVSIGGYRNASNSSWIYYKEPSWEMGKTYIYSSKVENTTNTSEGCLNSNILILTLRDKTKIYRNSSATALYVWEPNRFINGTYYKFNLSNNITVESSPVPVPGYKNKEIFYGPNPLRSDTDGDSLCDGLEYEWDKDSDNDGLINCLDRDSDNDDLLDGQEALSVMEKRDDWYSWKNDQDGDWIPNMVDLDSDNDMILDKIELMPLSDVDKDGLPNFIDIDSDGDALLDSFNDTNNNSNCEPEELGEDIDCDGIIDVEETSPIRKDSDSDLLSDWYETARIAYWFEAENQTYLNVTGVVVNDSFASSGKAATNNTNASEIAAITYQIVPGKYAIYVRARATPNATKGNLTIQRENEVEFNVTVLAGYYKWYYSRNYTLNTTLSVVISGENVYLDKIIVAKSNKTYNFSDPTDADTDHDGINDGDELQLTETDSIFNKYFTNPLNPDCDNDTLLDGQEVNGWHIMVGRSEEEYLVHVTSNPLLVDSDNDGLLDREEIQNAVYWLGEAENYRVNDTQLRENNTGITNKTKSNEIYNITLTLPKGKYLYYVKAKAGKNCTLKLSVNCSNVSTNSSLKLTNKYKWWSTKEIYINGTVNLLAFGECIVDKLHLIKKNSTLITKFADGSSEKVMNFTTAGSQTIYLEVPTNGGSVYILKAVLNVVGKYAKHDTIYINGNAQFTSENGVTSGNGTQANPYVIENWDIKAGTANGIEIRYTDAYFVIRNCVIHGKDNYTGIYFYNVTNGKIDNVISYQNYHGILLSGASNNKITNCEVYNNSRNGIHLLSSSNNKITNCEVYNNKNGVKVVMSSDNEVHNSNIYDNTAYGVFNYEDASLYEINATYNWWGSASGPRAPDHNGSGDNVSENVLYDPWLNERNQNAGYEEVVLVMTIDNAIAWQYSGTFNFTKRIDFSKALNQYLSAHGDTNVQVPLTFSAETGSQLVVSNLTIVVRLFATNPSDPDTDYDGLYDGDEIQWHEKDNISNTYPSEPADWDTDDDMLNDGKEVKGWEIMVEGVNENITYNVTSDPRDIDTDDDLIVDFLEYNRTNASSNDTDKDGLLDSLEYKVTFRTNASNGNYSAENVWVVVDGDKNGSLECFVFNTSKNFTDDQLQDNISNGLAVLLTVTPEGYEVYNVSAEIVINVSACSNPVFIINSTLNVSLSSKPTLPFAYNRQETYTAWTDVCDVDTDNDRLIDGNTTDPSILNKFKTSSLYYGAAPAEDRNNDGLIDSRVESNPLDPDTDNDLIIDGYEYLYVNQSGNMAKYSDSDNDGYINLCDSDSDNDGLTDGEENNNFDYSLSKSIEADPTDPDCDDDNLLDGAEPLWYNDTDNDSEINVWDNDSNEDDKEDYEQVFVIFRTNATDHDGDGNIDYHMPGTWIAVITLNHDPIYINGNSQFTPENGVVSGNGTQEDPYIIENWDIDARSANGIEIRNTDAYFIIRNCEIHDEKSNYNKGVYFYKVTNGKIDNITSYNNLEGIFLDEYSNNNQITNCNLYNNVRGIDLDDSLFNKITTCNIYNTDYGVWLDSSNYNKITNCNVYNNKYGIYLGYDSDGNKITNCKVYNNKYGIYLGYTFGNEVHHSNIYNNTKYGVYNSHTASQYKVNATHNWWGSADGPGGKGPGSGDNVSENVDYDPWLTEPNQNAGWGEVAPLERYWVLKRYDYSTTLNSIPSGLFNLCVEYVKGENKEKLNITTPEGYLVKGDGVNVYIVVNNTTVYKYVPSIATLNPRYLSITPCPNGTEWFNTNIHNFIANHQETYDSRLALDMDVDGDGLNNNIDPNKWDPDCDDDGIMDGDELNWSADPDKDGTYQITKSWANDTKSITYSNNCTALDPDSDNDGIPDGTEMGITTPTWGTNKSRTFTNIYGVSLSNFTADKDPSTITDVLHNDTDGDGLIDGNEDSNQNGQNGAFELGETDPSNKDTDFDGIEDGNDTHRCHADWDCDGILDGKDSKPENADHDGDGVSNSVELGLTTGIPGQDFGNTHYYGSSRSHGIYSFVADADPATTTDPLNNDTDSDGIKDGNEDSNQNGAFELGETDPNNVDTDADGILDGDEDRDQDGYWGLEDTEESDPRYVDSDSDGLQDQLEDKNKNGDWESDIGETCAYMKDSDEDGLWDGYNVTVNNIEHWGELTVGTNPLNPDTDGDGLSTSFPKIF